MSPEELFNGCVFTFHKTTYQRLAGGTYQEIINKHSGLVKKYGGDDHSSLTKTTHIVFPRQIIHTRSVLDDRDNKRGSFHDLLRRYAWITRSGQDVCPPRNTDKVLVTDEWISQCIRAGKVVEVKDKIMGFIATKSPPNRADKSVDTIVDSSRGDKGFFTRISRSPIPPPELRNPNHSRSPIPPPFEVRNPNQSIPPPFELRNPNRSRSPLPPPFELRNPNHDTRELTVGIGNQLGVVRIAPPTPPTPVAPTFHLNRPGQDTGSLSHSSPLPSSALLSPPLAHLSPSPSLSQPSTLVTLRRESGNANDGQTPSSPDTTVKIGRTTTIQTPAPAPAPEPTVMPAPPAVLNSGGYRRESDPRRWVPASRVRNQVSRGNADASPQENRLNTTRKNHAPTTVTCPPAMAINSSAPNNHTSPTTQMTDTLPYPTETDTPDAPVLFHHGTLSRQSSVLSSAPPSPPPDYTPTVPEAVVAFDTEFDVLPPILDLLPVRTSSLKRPSKDDEANEQQSPPLKRSRPDKSRRPDNGGNDSPNANTQHRLIDTHPPRSPTPRQSPHLPMDDISTTRAPVVFDNERRTVNRTPFPDPSISPPTSPPIPSEAPDEPSNEVVHQRSKTLPPVDRTTSSKTLEVSCDRRQTDHAMTSSPVEKEPPIDVPRPKHRRSQTPPGPSSAIAPAPCGRNASPTPVEIPIPSSASKLSTPTPKGMSESRKPMRDQGTDRKYSNKGHKPATPTYRYSRLPSPPDTCTLQSHSPKPFHDTPSRIPEMNAALNRILIGSTNLPLSFYLSPDVPLVTQVLLGAMGGVITDLESATICLLPLPQGTPASQTKHVELVRYIQSEQGRAVISEDWIAKCFTDQTILPVDEYRVKISPPQPEYDTRAVYPEDEAQGGWEEAESIVEVEESDDYFEMI